MDVELLPQPLKELSAVVVPALQDVYDLNAARHDELAGDDAVTFGISIYRNSWFRLEQELQGRDGWQTARPDGSLLVSAGGYRIHVYRVGQDERVDLDGFRLDQTDASLTKRLIAKTNGQLVLALDLEPSEIGSRDQSDLRDLVIVHAGNPDDGCCGIWIGAPVPAQQVIISPWAWLMPLWIIERPEQSTGEERDIRPPVPHDELPEPHVEVTPVEDDASSAEEA